MRYESPPTTVSEQLTLLRERGMEIKDEKKARVFLCNVGYYRFTGYALHFEHFKNRNRTHRFKESTCFENVVEVYEFDSSLRSLLFDSVGDIEIAFRSQLCSLLSLQTGDSHWPLNANLFNQRFDHPKFIEEVRKETMRSREVFIEEYKNRYTFPDLPAAWMLVEILSFGTWSRVYSSLKSQQVKKDLAQYFGLSPYILKSWIHALTVLRNSCAHHARIWNASLTIKPEFTKRMDRYFTRNSLKRDRIVSLIYITGELLKPLGKYNTFIDRINGLFRAHPNVPYDSMGLNRKLFDYYA